MVAAAGKTAPQGATERSVGTASGSNSCNNTQRQHVGHVSAQRHVNAEGNVWVSAVEGRSATTTDLGCWPRSVFEDSSTIKHRLLLNHLAVTQVRPSLAFLVAVLLPPRVFLALTCLPALQLLGGQADAAPTQAAATADAESADSGRFHALQSVEDWATQFIAKQRAELCRMVRAWLIVLARTFE
jgi:hypothetical protein